MMRTRILFAALGVTGCSYFQSGPVVPAGTVDPSKTPAKVSAMRLASGSGVVKAMHDL
jgi:hypothetical protein